MSTIKKIKNIKNCPSFVNFSSSVDLPEFSRFNLIYGWNGSGKTSLSRILRSFELQENYYENFKKVPEFKLILDDDTIVDQDNLKKLDNIRVFNKDFIDENVFCAAGPKPIFFFGKKNKEDEKKILQNNQDLDSLNIQNKGKNELLKKLQEKHEESLTDKAREIRTSLTTPMSDEYHNYERTSLIKRINGDENSQKTYSQYVLKANMLAKLKKSIMQTSKSRIIPIAVPNIEINDLVKRVSAILNKTVVSEAIKSLKSDNEINQWVEHGLHLHKLKNLKTCAFCNQTIPAGRFSQLEKHFNDAYRNILESIREIKINCENRKISFKPIESSEFYEDLIPQYLMEKLNAERTIKEFNDLINKLIQSLEQKEQNLFERKDLVMRKSIKIDSFVNINKVIEENNGRTANFEKQIKEDKKMIENHYIGEFFAAYIKNTEELTVLRNECEKIDQLITQKVKENDDLKSNLISHHVSAQQLNEDLEKFLGRSDIQIKPSDDAEGYEILRNGEIASDLSEGEKTSIAIIYFLTKIKEESFDLKKGIVIIDDPVSSLDSNTIFLSFSFIKNAVKEAKQVIIFTHHFDFFRQIKNWFKYLKRNGQSVSYFMVTCKSVDGDRNSSLINVDKLLINYESEYHFLFSILYNFEKKEKKELAEMYNIPNVVRKFLESFLAFRVPIGTKEPSIWPRLEKIKGDQIKKERVGRFAETHSHPRYESGVQDFDMTILSETVEIVKDLLNIVRTEDKRHYDFLVKSLN